MNPSSHPKNYGPNFLPQPKHSGKLDSIVRILFSSTLQLLVFHQFQGRVCLLVQGNLMVLL